MHHGGSEEYSQWWLMANGNDDTDDGYDDTDDGNDAFRYSVGLHEGVWKRVDRPGEPANREHMLMALAGLEYIIVKVDNLEIKVKAKKADEKI